MNAALQTLANGGLPNVLRVYRAIGEAVQPLHIRITQFEGDNDVSLARSTTTCLGSLLPIGIINYYYTPITLGGIN